MYNDQLQKFRRRQLRKNPTEAETILWQEVRDKKMSNLRFHRQYSVSPYILDFFCPKIRLAIELDGDQYKSAKEYDAERESFLKGKGIITIRFWNNEILKNLPDVLEKITEVQRSLPPLVIREEPHKVRRVGYLLEIMLIFAILKSYERLLSNTRHRQKSFKR